MFDTRRVSVDHVTSVHNYGYHACNFTICEGHHCTMYAVEVASQKIATLKPRELAEHVLERFDLGVGVAVVKTWTEG